VTGAPSLAELGEGVREAVAEGDFARAARQWTAYAAALRASLARDPAPADRLRETLALIDWTRQACAAGQARLRDELSSLRICLSYSAPDAAPHRILRIRA
jgi:hypothetical protein